MLSPLVSTIYIVLLNRTQPNSRLPHIAQLNRYRSIVNRITGSVACFHFFLDNSSNSWFHRLCSCQFLTGAALSVTIFTSLLTWMVLVANSMSLSEVALEGPLHAAKYSLPFVLSLSLSKSWSKEMSTGLDFEVRGSGHAYRLEGAFSVLSRVKSDGTPCS